MKIRLFCPAALVIALTASGPSCANGAGATAAGGAILDSSQLAHASGAVIYQHICQACHMAGAEGAAGAGHVPALASDVRLASVEYVAVIVLNGQGDMPAFRPRPDYTGLEALDHVTLSDSQIAAVINFVRSHFGNHYRDRITPAEVRAVRARVPARPGGCSAALPAARRLPAPS